MSTSTTTIIGIPAASLFAVVILPTAAHAQYLDPGAGSIILQAVIAALIGTTAAIKIYWRRISAFISKRRKDGGER